jgi:hypothetical protein
VPGRAIDDDQPQRHHCVNTASGQAAGKKEGKQKSDPESIIGAS